MDSAWDAFFKESTRNVLDDLKKEGWMSVFEICQKLKIKKNKCIDKMKKDKRFESGKFKVIHQGVTREMLFFKFKK